MLFGVNEHLLWPERHGGRYNSLTAIKASNASVVRMDLDWAQLEPDAQGVHDAAYLAKIDGVVEACALAGVRPLFVVLWTPCWASSAPDSIKQGCAPGWRNRGVASYPPSDPEASYARTIRFLARRYGPKLAGLQLWNEPNQTYFWNGTPAEYVNMVRAVYPVVKAATTEVPIVAGPLSLADTTFAEALYDAGIKGSFDIFSMHPYTFDTSPLANTGFNDGIPAVRAVMESHGDYRKIWLTEFGWTTTQGGPITGGLHALFVRNAFRFAQSLPYVDAAFYYTFQDLGPDITSPSQNYGLLRHGFSEKPAYAEFKRQAGNALPRRVPRKGRKSR